jgi:hypothetical protein
MLRKRFTRTVISKFMSILIRGYVYRCWIFSWAMSHICANDEYRSQVGTTNRPENIVVSVVSLSLTLSYICM